MNRHSCLLALFMAAAAAVWAAPAKRGRHRPAKGALMAAQECRALLRRRDSGLWSVGVENAGDPNLTATMQQVRLGEFAGGNYRPVCGVSEPGHVYFSAAAQDETGLWIVWSQMQAGEWRVMARRWDKGRLGPLERVSGEAGPALWPSVVATEQGALCAWSAPGERDFDVWSSEYREGKWRPAQRVTGPGFHEMRPSLAAGRNGRVWLAYDYYAHPHQYRVDLREYSQHQWGRPRRLMQHHQSPQVRVAPDGAVWVVTNDMMLVGWRGGKKLWPKLNLLSLVKGQKGFRPWTVSFDETGRPWVFAARRGKRMAGGMLLAAVSGEKFEGKQPLEGNYRSYLPPLVAGGKIYLCTDPAGGKGRLRVLPAPAPAGPAMATRVMALAGEPKPPQLAEVKGFRPTMQVNGKTYTVYFGELHTHLGERPADVEMRDWVDRFYLDAHYKQRLDVAGVSDHDWPSMIQSKYLVQQAIARVMTAPGDFVGLTGFEWSGKGQVRKRYGDRTVIFPPGYFMPPRITDPGSNTPHKLHAALRKFGAIDWAHHLGAPWAVMDWTTFEGDVEPVMEMTSNHGVFETYDPKQRVPVRMLAGRKPVKSLADPNVDKTSIQYGLSQGYRFGLVGSSDSHSGFSGYKTGMVGLLASELTPAGLFEAWRARRCYAVRGGQRIRMRVSAGAVCMGQETAAAGPPGFDVEIVGTNQLTRVEVISNSRVLYTQRPKSCEASFQFRDVAAGAGEHCYYVRVWQAEGGYAWSSPLWFRVE